VILVRTDSEWGRMEKILLRAHGEVSELRRRHEAEVYRGEGHLI